MEHFDSHTTTKVQSSLLLVHLSDPDVPVLLHRITNTTGKLLVSDQMEQIEMILLTFHSRAMVNMSICQQPLGR